MTSVRTLLKHHLVVRPLIEAARRCNARLRNESGKETLLCAEPMPRLTELTHILVVRMDGIGDFVLTIPFLRELRRSAPQARITLIVIRDIFDLARNCPYVDRCIAAPAGLDSRVCKSYRRRYSLASRFTIEQFKQDIPDLAIVPRWDADSFFAPFVACLSGARWRLGYSNKVNVLKRRHNYGYDRLFTHTIDRTDLEHEVRRNLDVLEWLGGQVVDEQLECWASDKDAKRVAQLLGANSLFSDSDAPLVALAPFAGARCREWPAERYLAIAKWLAKTHGARIVLVGGPADKLHCDQLAAGLGDAVNMAGVLTVAELTAMLRRCHLYLGNDTGPTHVASTAGIPMVVFSAHAVNGGASSRHSTVRFAPWCQRASVLRPQALRYPCVEACTAATSHCIAGISLDDAKVAITKVLEASSTIIRSSGISTGNG